MYTEGSSVNKPRQSNRSSRVFFFFLNACLHCRDALTLTRKSKPNDILRFHVHYIVSGHVSDTTGVTSNESQG